MTLAIVGLKQLPALALVPDPSPHFEVMNEVRYELVGDLLTIDVHSATFGRHYRLTWHHCEAEIIRLRHCRDDDPDYQLTDGPLDPKEAEELRRWLEAYDGPGSAAEIRARLMSDALTIHDPL